MLRFEILDGRTLFQKMTSLNQALEAEILQLEKALRKYPSEDFYCFKDGDDFKWRIRTNKKTTYLSKTQQDHACLLTYKKRDAALLKDLKHDLKEVKQYLLSHKDYPMESPSRLSRPTNRFTRERLGASPL